jgi:transcriptional antiterminator NusG
MYVLQCISGKEADVQSEIFSQGYTARVPAAVRIERCGGRWLDRLRVLMPGYVFVDSPMHDDLYHSVKGVDGVIRWLNPGEPVPLYENEVAFIRKLTADNRPLLPIDIETTPHLRIHNSPLTGLEHQIVELRRRQQRIRMRATVLGEEHTVFLSANFRETPSEHH